MSADCPWIAQYDTDAHAMAYEWPQHFKVEQHIQSAVACYIPNHAFGLANHVQSAKVADPPQHVQYRSTAD